MSAPEPAHTLHLNGPGGLRARVRCAPGANVLDAVLDAGWQVPHSCRKGVCQACRATLQSGELHAPRVGADGVLLCRARACGDAELTVSQLEHGQLPQHLCSQARVYALRRVAPEVVYLELRLPNGVRPQWRAGQSLELTAPDGTVRRYSMARPPRADHSLHLHIRLVPGGRFSQWLHTALEQAAAPAPRPLETLSVRLPFGHLGLPADGSRPAVLLAAGTGFSALGAIAEEALARGDTRALHLYWGVRRRADLYDLERAQALARAHPALRVVPVLSEPEPGAGWSGRTGLVHHALMQDFPDLGNTDVLACGSPAMLQAAEHDLRRERGLRPERWRSDPFHPAPVLAAAGDTGDTADAADAADAANTAEG